MPETPGKFVALIVAAGSGSRVGNDIPKQFLPLYGKAMLYHSFKTFSTCPQIEETIVVIGEGQEELAKAALDGLPTPQFVKGGDSRRASVSAGLEAIDANGGADFVLIHDAARPMLPEAVIGRLLAGLAENPGAVPVLPIVDSLARGDQLMEETVDREGLWRIQTPQAFHFAKILTVHRAWDGQKEPTDDARMAMAAGLDVLLVEGDEALAKYTFANDFTAGSGREPPMMRIGNGYDVHRLVPGGELWLCGVKIEHSHGLAGHSDADVAIHALVDAILGALALGDIGEHFPPSDPQWRGAASEQFLGHAIRLASDAGYLLANADLTIICEAPKIGPHRQKMRERLAEITGVQLSQISVKATTSEKLGFTGRAEGIAAQAAVCMMERSKT